MPTYQIEMLWTCRICRADGNRGLQKHCTSCGKPKDAQDEERFPDDITEANALSGEDQRKALAGPDWQCKYCKTLQNSLGRCCGECGADRNTGTRDWEQKGETFVTEGEPRKPKRQAKKPRIEVDPFRGWDDRKRSDAGQALPEEVSPPPVSRDFLEHGGGYREAPKTAEPVSRDFVPNTGGYRTPPEIFIPKIPWHHRPRVRQIAATGLIGTVVVLILWLVFRTKVVDAHVETVAWEHDVVVDRYQVYRKEGWSPDNGAFETHDEGRRVHHYDHVQVGSHQESYQESYTCGENCTTIRGSCTTTPRSCTSNKNGTATCTGGDRVCSPDTKSCSPKTCTRTAHRTVPDYEDQPRYQTWYSWKVWDWGQDRVVRAAGSSMETRWPSDAELVPNRPLVDREQERHRRVERYTVVFSDRKDSWTVHPKSEDDFHRFPPGSRFKLKVGFANGVTVLGNGGTTTDY